MSDALESWRLQMDINSFVLAGHSLGAHAVTAYSVRFPDRVRHLFLISPVGVGIPPKFQPTDNDCLNWILDGLWNNYSAMDFFRFAGPIGRVLMTVGFRLRATRAHGMVCNDQHPLYLLSSFTLSY